MTSTPTFFLYELAINQEIQNKAREEVFNKLAKYDGKLSYESINAMRYIDQCIYEVLRKYPTVQLQRVASKEYKIPDTNITIPTGTSVYIPVYAFHYDEKIFPEPEKFDPNRFTQEEIQKRHSMSFLTFGNGPRSCIGKRFGLLVVKLGLIKILMNYRFTIDRSKNSVPLKLDIKCHADSITPPDIYMKFSKIYENNNNIFD
jgi:cytochrome P450 family 6